MNKRNGYNEESKEWIIHGLRFTDEFFSALATANGEIYRFERKGDAVTIRRLDYLQKYINNPNDGA